VNICDGDEKRKERSEWFWDKTLWKEFFFIINISISLHSRCHRPTSPTTTPLFISSFYLSLPLILPYLAHIHPSVRLEISFSDNYIICRKLSFSQHHTKMSPELARIKENLARTMVSTTPIEREQELEEIHLGTMIRFWPDPLKFLMIKPPKGFSLDTFPPRMPSKPEVLIRPTNDVPCGVLTDAATPRSEKTSKKDQAGDLVLLTTRNQEGTHIYGEHGN
jgi:hypothetical protein